MEPRVVENLKNAEGEPFQLYAESHYVGVGASNNKPFYDRTHEILAFRVK
jgi:CDGSH-type Zn-finger protein